MDGQGLEHLNLRGCSDLVYDLGRKRVNLIICGRSNKLVKSMFFGVEKYVDSKVMLKVNVQIIFVERWLDYKCLTF